MIYAILLQDFMKRGACILNTKICILNTMRDHWTLRFLFWNLVSSSFLIIFNNIHGYCYAKWKFTIPLFELQRQQQNAEGLSNTLIVWSPTCLPNFPIAPCILTDILCLKVWACIIYSWVKGKHFHNPYLW